MKRVFVMAMISLLLIAVGCKNKGKEQASTSENTTAETTGNDFYSEKRTDEKKLVEIYANDKYSQKINKIVLSYYGDTETSVGLTWYTLTADSENFGNDVEVYNELGIRQTGSYSIEHGVSANDEKSQYHQSVINGLIKGTKYYYRVGDAPSGEWSKYGSFTTSSREQSSYSYAIVTDTQGNGAEDAYFSADSVKSAAKAAKKPAFIMHCGDITDKGTDEHIWSAMINAAQNELMNNVIVPAVGNHDSASNVFWQHFKLEATNGHKTTGMYYSYNYGNAHYTVLDTNKSTKSSYIDDEQLKWLESDLKKAKEDGYKWLIVSMHRGLYTIGDHSDGELIGESRKRVGEVFDKYGVDIVFEGHDHCPSVTKGIKNGAIDESGTCYISIGTSGSKAYNYNAELGDEYISLYEYYDKESREDKDTQEYGVVDISDDFIKVTIYQKFIENREGSEKVLYEKTVSK